MQKELEAIEKEIRDLMDLNQKRKMLKSQEVYERPPESF